MDESFPTDASINAYYDGAKTRAKNGEVDEDLNQIRRSTD